MDLESRFERALKKGDREDKSKRAHWSAQLVTLRACEDAVTWAKGQPSLAAAWSVCERGDWMLWLIGCTTASVAWSEERKPLVRVVCAIARMALKYVRAGEDRPRIAIETAEAWCDGKATREEVIKARSAASASASDPGAASAYAYAYASAASAAASAYASAYASAASAAAAARRASYRELAGIVRQHFAKPPRIAQVCRD